MIKKFFAALLVAVSLLVTFVAQAEIKTYAGVGEDYANRFETQDDAKARALLLAIEDAKKHAGVALKTFSRSVNSELTDDEVLTITSNSWQLVGEPQFTREIINHSDKTSIIVWRVTVNVDVDDAEVKSWFKRTLDERNALVNRNRAAQEAFDANIRTADDLNKRAAENLTEAEEFDLRHGVEANNNDFQVNRKIEDGNRLNYEDKPDAALDKYGEALKIKFVDGVGEYLMHKDIDNLEVAKMRSKAQAERSAVEAGISYLKDYSRRINLDLTDDEIHAIAANTRETVDVEQQIVPTQDDSELIIRTNAKFKFRGDEVIGWLKRDKNERAKFVEEYLTLQKEIDDNRRADEQLHQQYKFQRR